MRTPSPQRGGERVVHTPSRTYPGGQHAIQVHMRDIRWQGQQSMSKQTPYGAAYESHEYWPSSVSQISEKLLWPWQQSSPMVQTTTTTPSTAPRRPRTFAAGSEYSPMLRRIYPPRPIAISPLSPARAAQRPTTRLRPSGNITVSTATPPSTAGQRRRLIGHSDGGCIYIPPKFGSASEYCSSTPSPTRLSLPSSANGSPPCLPQRHGSDGVETDAADRTSAAARAPRRSALRQKKVDTDSSRCGVETAAAVDDQGCGRSTGGMPGERQCSPRGETTDARGGALWTRATPQDAARADDAKWAGGSEGIPVKTGTECALTKARQRIAFENKNNKNGTENDNNFHEDDPHEFEEAHVTQAAAAIDFDRRFVAGASPCDERQKSASTSTGEDVVICRERRSLQPRCGGERPRGPETGRQAAAVSSDRCRAVGKSRRVTPDWPLWEATEQRTAASSNGCKYDDPCGQSPPKPSRGLARRPPDVSEVTAELDLSRSEAEGRECVVTWMKKTDGAVEAPIGFDNRPHSRVGQNVKSVLERDDASKRGPCDAPRPVRHNYRNNRRAELYEFSGEELKTAENPRPSAAAESRCRERRSVGGRATDPVRAVPSDKRYHHGCSVHHDEFIDCNCDPILILHPVAPDGNCLFRAVSQQVLGSDVRHLEVRNLCVHEIRENRQRYAGFIVGNFEDYVANMSRSGTWGDEVEIQALGLALSRPIQIFEVVPSSDSSENEFDACSSEVACNNSIDSTDERSISEEADDELDDIHEFPSGLMTTIPPRGRQCGRSLRRQPRRRRAATLRASTTAGLHAHVGGEGSPRAVKLRGRHDRLNHTKNGPTPLASVGCAACVERTSPQRCSFFSGRNPPNLQSCSISRPMTSSMTPYCLPSAVTVTTIPFLSPNFAYVVKRKQPNVAGGRMPARRSHASAWKGYVF